MAMIPTVKLNDGVEIPVCGFGTFQPDSPGWQHLQGSADGT